MLDVVAVEAAYCAGLELHSPCDSVLESNSSAISFIVFTGARVYWEAREKQHSSSLFLYELYSCSIVKVTCPEAMFGGPMQMDGS